MASLDVLTANLAPAIKRKSIGTQTCEEDHGQVYNILNNTVNEIITGMCGICYTALIANSKIQIWKCGHIVCQTCHVNSSASCSCCRGEGNNEQYPLTIRNNVIYSGYKTTEDEMVNGIVDLFSKSQIVDSQNQRAKHDVKVITSENQEIHFYPVEAAIVQEKCITCKQSLRGIPGKIGVTACIKFICQGCRDTRGKSTMFAGGNCKGCWKRNANCPVTDVYVTPDNN